MPVQNRNLVSAWPHTGLSWARISVVLDANVLMNDCLRATRDQRPTIFIAIARYQSAGTGSRHVAAIRSVGRAGMERVGELADAARDATALLESAAIVTTDSANLRCQVAREVAVAPESPTRRELATRFGTSMDELASVLDEPMFVRTGRGRYRLGSAVPQPPAFPATSRVN
jgi:hypothetical protein